MSIPDRTRQNPFKARIINRRTGSVTIYENIYNVVDHTYDNPHEDLYISYFDSDNYQPTDTRTRVHLPVSNYIVNVSGSRSKLTDKAEPYFSRTDYDEYNTQFRKLARTVIFNTNTGEEIIVPFTREIYFGNYWVYPDQPLRYVVRGYDETGRRIEITVDSDNYDVYYVPMQRVVPVH